MADFTDGLRRDFSQDKLQFTEMPLSTSRDQFLAANALGSSGDIQYARRGGWFVSTRRALFLGLAFVASLIIVGLLVHYLGRETVEKVVTPSPGPVTSETPPMTPTSAPTSSSTPTTTMPSPTPHASVRLNPDLRPHLYTLKLKPFIGLPDSNFSFEGEVTILLGNEGGSPFSELTLHSKDLNITEDAVTIAPQTKIISQKSSIKDQTHTFVVDPPLLPGVNYTLHIPFKGVLRENLAGFYRSSYVEDGVTKWLATTQFESTDARAAFPCFDEPAMKAEFDISIVHLRNLTAISNMPIMESSAVSGEPDWVVDHFEVSPKMSTYLVAFVVSEMVMTNLNDSSKPSFHLLSRPHLKDQSTYALYAGKTVLAYYDEYFGIPFPLPKMDMAAIPDFAAGAMENWGLVTYRESFVLWGKNTSTTAYKEHVLTVVTHELAHQWFGNLVTMNWWSDLWLNEGFATYVQYIGANHVEPTWLMLEKFVKYEMQYVLGVDALKSSHPISVNVSNPGQIQELFDDISYSKGACLIRMLNNTLTEPLFRKGLRQYLNTWKYANAKQDDLWDAFSSVAKDSLPPGVTVKDFMDSWTLTKGYPVVNVTRNYEKGTASLVQTRFTLDGNGDDSTLWCIPVSYGSRPEAANLSTHPRVWMCKERSKEIDLKDSKASPSDWLLVNVQQSGYFRVNYDVRNWRLLGEQLMKDPLVIPPTSRSQLLDDSLNLARAGLLSYDVALNLTMYLQDNESHVVVWSVFYDAFKHILENLRNDRSYSLLTRYYTITLNPILKKLTMEPQQNETQPDTLLRISTVEELAKYDDAKIQDWASKLFTDWMSEEDPDEKNPIPTDYRPVVYCSALRTGGEAEYEFAFQRLINSSGKPSEVDYLITGLACTTKPWLISDLLDKSLAEKDIRLQDSYRVWRAMRSNPVGAKMAFDYMRQNWDALYKKYGAADFPLKDIIKGATAGLSSKIELDDLIRFRDDHQGQFEYTATTLAQAIEGLTNRVQWQEKFRGVIDDWLRDYYKNGGSRS